MKIFIYGSLMRGNFNNHKLKGQKFLGRGQTDYGFKLISFRYFPGLVVSLTNVNISGEVWEVDGQCLQSLDHMELSSGYKREVSPMLDPFKDKVVHAYLYKGRVYPDMKYEGTSWKQPKRL